MAAQDEDDRRDEDELDEDVSDEDEDVSEDADEGEDDAEDADEDESDEDESGEDESEDDAEAAEDDAEDADEDDAEEVDEDAAQEDASDDDDGDRAADVARALGVGDDEDEEEGADDEDDDEKKATNRAERRRQRARRRRRRRQGKSDDEESPKDRNKKKRDELLARRRKAADEADDEDEAVEGLAATEMVEDALARGTNAGIKWIQNNWKVLQWVITAGLVVGVGGLVYVWQTNKTQTAAADAFAAGLELEYAAVISDEDDKRTDEQKQRDFRTIYKSDAEKQQAVLDKYAKVSSEHAGTAPATLAKMGEAGVLLDKRDWDGAVAAFDQVLGSELAGSDADLKARALESKGFALESKGDLAGAATVYQELSGSELQLYQLTAKFHQARVLHLQKKDTEAIALLKEAREAVSKAKIDARLKFEVTPYRWLEREVKELLMVLDPSEIPVRPKTPGGQITPEMIQEMLREQGIQGGMVPPQ